jgi:hypothetical protein
LNTVRAILTSIHGICFGCFFLLASFGLVVGTAAATGTDVSPLRASCRRVAFERLYLLVTAALAWVAVLSGTYLIYPWYRATPPPHATDLRHFSRQLLVSNAATAKWHSIGMEWKEHVSFVAPIVITSVAYVCWRHRDLVVRDPQVRRLVLGFSLMAVAAAGIAACTGAFLNKLAPIF